MRLLTLTACLLAATAARCETPDPVLTPDPLPVVWSPPRPAIDLQPRGTPMEKKDTPPLTYSEARRLALESGKPLLVWVGGEFCPACVKASAEEFVHCFVPAFEDAANPSIVVAVVDDGELVRAGDVTWWIEGDREFGHVPSVRSVIRAWRDRRTAIRQARVSVVAPSAVTVYQRSTYQRFSAPPPPAIRFILPRGRAGCSS